MFDIFAMAEGTTYPEDSVDIYTDNDAAYQIAKLDEKINNAYRYSLTAEEQNKLETDRANLKAKLDETRVTVHMQGLPERKLNQIRKEQDAKYGEDLFPDARKEEWQNRLIQAHLRKAVNAKGEEQDLKDQDVDKVAVWYMQLPKESQNRLDRLVMDLTLKAGYFENAEITTDFS